MQVFEKRNAIASKKPGSAENRRGPIRLAGSQRSGQATFFSFRVDRNPPASAASRAGGGSSFLAMRVDVTRPPLEVPVRRWGCSHGMVALVRQDAGFSK